MASQLINDGLPALQLNLTKRAAYRLDLLTGKGSNGLAGLTSAEVSERYVAIEGEIDKLAKLLRVFLIGLLLLGLVVVSTLP